MNNLLIRVDSTYEIGMGHFMRTLSLAQRWQKENDNIYFLINDNSILKKKILDENMKYMINPFKSGTIDDAEFLLDVVFEKNISRLTN